MVLGIFKSNSEGEVIKPQKPFSKQGRVVPPGHTEVKELKSNGMTTEKTTKSPVTYNVVEAERGNRNHKELPEVEQHTGEIGEKIFSSGFATCQLVVPTFEKSNGFEKQEESGIFHSWSCHSDADIRQFKERVSGQKSNYYVMPALPQQFNEHQKNSYIFVQDKPDSKTAKLYYIDKDKKPHEIKRDESDNAKIIADVRKVLKEEGMEKHDFPTQDFYRYTKDDKNVLKNLSDIDNFNEEKKKNISTLKMKEVLIFQKQEHFKNHEDIPYLALHMAMQFNCKNVKVVPVKAYSSAYVEDGKVTIFNTSSPDDITIDKSKSASLNVEEAEKKETSSYLDLKECFEQVFAMEKKKGSTITQNKNGDFCFVSSDEAHKLTVPVEFVPEEYRKEAVVVKTPKQAIQALEERRKSVEHPTTAPVEQQPQKSVEHPTTTPLEQQPQKSVEHPTTTPLEQQPQRKRHTTVHPVSNPTVHPVSKIEGPPPQQMLEKAKPKYANQKLKVEIKKDEVEKANSSLK